MGVGQVMHTRFRQEFLYFFPFVQLRGILFLLLLFYFYVSRQLVCLCFFFSFLSVQGNKTRTIVEKDTCRQNEKREIAKECETERIRKKERERVRKERKVILSITSIYTRLLYGLRTCKIASLITPNIQTIPSPTTKTKNEKSLLKYPRRPKSNFISAIKLLRIRQISK